MSERRNTYKYHVKVGRKIIYSGITNDLERRSAEHKSRWPNSHVVKVGRRTTREQAAIWREKADMR